MSFKLWKKKIYKSLYYKSRFSEESRFELKKTLKTNKLRSIEETCPLKENKKTLLRNKDFVN